MESLQTLTNPNAVSAISSIATECAWLIGRGPNGSTVSHIDM